METPECEEHRKEERGATGNVFITDAHQVRNVPQAIEYLKMLADIKPWFTEEPTAPDEFHVSPELSLHSKNKYSLPLSRK